MSLFSQPEHPAWPEKYPQSPSHLDYPVSKVELYIIYYECTCIYVQYICYIYCICLQGQRQKVYLREGDEQATEMSGCVAANGVFQFFSVI